MKSITLIIIMLISSVGLKAQTPPPQPKKKLTTAQPARPSKETTIKYLNDKLNANCVGESKIENETWYREGSLGLQYYKSATYKNYSVEEMNGVAYIIINERYRVKQYDFDTRRLDDNYNSIIIKIPVTKIKDILIYDIPATSKSGGIAKSAEAYRGIFFTTTGDNIIYYNGNKDATSYINIYAIPSFNADFEMNFKKAVINLKSFYKLEKDPFDN